MNKKSIRFVISQSIRSVISRHWLQPIWEKGLKLCHAGMNVGGGNRTDNSGELKAIKWYFESLNGKKDYCIFDVGANDGEFTDKSIQLIGNGGKFFCFEPQKFCYERLRERFLNKNNIFVFNFALGNENKIGKIYYLRKGDAIASLTPNIYLQDKDYELQQDEISIKTLDSFCHENKISVIDYLKIDVEGHEMDVLLGCEKMISSGAIKCIQFEFGDTCLSTRIFFKDFFELLNKNYYFFRVLRNGVWPIKNYDCRFVETFRITNYLAIHKEYFPSKQ